MKASIGKRFHRSEIKLLRRSFNGPTGAVDSGTPSPAPALRKSLWVAIRNRPKAPHHKKHHLASSWQL